MKRRNESLYNHLDITSDGKYIWYISEFSLLMQIEIATGNVVCLGRIPFTGEKSFVYTRIFYASDRLVLIPSFSERICEFDLRERQFLFYEFPIELKKIVGSNGVFTGKTNYNDFIYFYGKYPVIVKYHIFQHTFQIYNLNLNEIGNNYANKCFYSNGVLIQNILVIPTYDYKYLIAMDLVEDRINYYRLKLKQEDVFGGAIGCSKDKLYVAVTDNKANLLITECDSKTGNIDGWEYEIGSITRIGIVDNKLLVFGTEDLYVIILDEKELIHIELSFLVDNLREEKFVPEILHNEKNYTVFFDKNKLIFELDMETLEYNVVNIFESKELGETLNKIFEQVLADKNIISEACGYATIDTFIRHNTTFELKEAFKTSAIGTLIWNESRE